MNARLVHKKPGQSIPLIALILVVLLGMVGLSVDVGNTYAEQRSAVRATNAAALAGMSTLIAGGDDQAVSDTISASLRSNKINLADSPDVVKDGQRGVEAHYMGPDGKYLSDCLIGRCGTVPQGVAFIQVKLTGKVATYFARIVGRDTLPVSANAFSAQCLPINGVYPIAIRNSDLDANGWLEQNGIENGTYSDTNYQNKTMRRIYLKEDGTSTERFSLLQWSNTNNTAAAFQDDGTLDSGFTEVTPWPDTQSAAPANYPLAPEQLSLGDWMQGNNNGVTWAQVSAALEQQRAAKTVMILPIIQGEVGSGGTAAYHLARLGQFYVYKVGGPSEKYIDLVYLGQVNGTSCLQTNVEPPTTNCPPNDATCVPCPPDDPTCIPPPIRVLGQAFVKPRWKSDNTNKPISYQVVLDVSGSMSANYFGLATMNATHYKNPSKDSTGGTDYWCSDWYNPDAPPSNNNYPKLFNCSVGGNNAVWRKYQERRIFVAKQAIKGLINDMNVQDTMRIITFSTSQGTGNAKVAPSSGWSNDHTLLSGALDAAGTYNSDPYRTEGGTPGADALKATRDLLKAGNKPKTSPDGRKYKDVIIYLTDGMANVFLGGAANDARDICSDISVQESKATGRCQIGKTSKGVLRPITAMIDQSDKIKAENEDVTIYTIGMAGVDETGLGQIASSPDKFYAANQPGVLDSILLDIKGRESDACQESGASGINPAWDKIKPENKSEFSGQYALPDGVYGYVYLYDDKKQPLPGNQYKHAITQDKTGHLSWEMPEGTGLAPGNYIMNAWIGVKGPDGISRVYSAIENQATLKQTADVQISISYKDVLNDEIIVPPVTLVLDGLVCPGKN